MKKLLIENYENCNISVYLATTDKIPAIELDKFIIVEYSGKEYKYCIYRFYNIIESFLKDLDDAIDNEEYCETIKPFLDSLIENEENPCPILDMYL